MSPPEIDTPAPRGPDRGFALVVVIWIVGLLAMLTLSFGEVVRSHLTSVSSASESASAEALADGGIALVARDLVRGAADRNAQRRFPVDARISSHCLLGRGELWVALTDAGGLVDLNTSTDQLLTALLLGLGLDSEAARQLAAAVLDYRDTDNTVRPGGAEKDEYAAAGRPAGPKNAPFDSVSELEQVLGMSKPLVKRITPFVTVHSQLTGVDERAAPPELLDILQAGARALPFEFGMSSFSEPLTGAGDGILPGALRAVSSRRSFHVHIDAKSGRAWFAREAVITTNTGSARPFRIAAWRHTVTSPMPALAAVAVNGNCMDDAESR